MPWSTEDLKRLVDLESQRQHVDPRLSRAVVSQESEWNPNAVGDNGNSIGLFQLQPGAAKDAGLHPRFRSNPAENIKAGVTYLGQKLKQSGGNVEQALSRYNRGTPDYRGIGDPNYVQNVLKYYPDYQTPSAQPQQKPGLMARVGNALSPASAEAAAPQTQPQASGMSRLHELEAELTRREGQAPPHAPTAPTATSTPEQDAAYRASRGQLPPPPVSQTAPTVQTPPGGSQGPQMRLSLGDPQGAASEAEARATIEQMRARQTQQTQQTPAMERFLALPSIVQLTPPERAQVQAEFQALPPDQQEQVIQQEVPQDLTQAMAKPQESYPRRPGDTMRPAERPQVLPSQVEAPITESLTAPSTMIPLLMPGAGLKLVPGAGLKLVPGALKTAAPFVNRALRPVAEGLSQTAGWTAGRTAETGEVPSPTEIGTEAALNVLAGGILEGLGATGQAMLRRSPAGKAIAAADEATTAARQQWQQEVATAKAAQAAGRTEAYQAAERRAREAQVRYQTKVEARDAIIAANEQTYQEALAASKAEAQAEQARRYGQARTETTAEVGAAQARQQQYQQAVTGQQQAMTQARAVPGQYQPQTPSWVQYEKFGDAAKDAVVDLTPAKAALADVRASRGVLPDGSIRPFPAAVESMAANLEKATGDTSFKTIREELRRLGPLTKSQDGNVRGAAKQLYGIYADVLEASPVANDLLRNANATFRKEMAVQDIADWLKPGHGIVRIDNMGRETINVGALMTRLQKTVADDSLFRRSFAPDELDALRTDLRQLAGTPTMPRGAMPPAATPELLPGAAPNIPASMQTPTPKAIPPEVARPRVEHLPGGAGPGRRVPGAGPEPGPVTPREALGERPKVFKGLTRTAMQDYMGSLFGLPPGLIMGSRGLLRLGTQGRYGMARALLSQGRPSLLRALADSPTISPRIHATAINALSDAERKALLRETREAREQRR